eukprot:913239_1
MTVISLILAVITTLWFLLSCVGSQSCVIESSIPRGIQSHQTAYDPVSKQEDASNPEEKNKDMNDGQMLNVSGTTDGRTNFNVDMILKGSANNTRSECDG